MLLSCPFLIGKPVLAGVLGKSPVFLGFCPFFGILSIFYANSPMSEVCCNKLHKSQFRSPVVYPKYSLQPAAQYCVPEMHDSLPGGQCNLPEVQCSLFTILYTPDIQYIEPGVKFSTPASIGRRYRPMMES